MAIDFDADDRANPDSGVFGLAVGPDDAAVILVPVPFDASTSWGRGAADAPRAITTASHQIDLYDPLVGTPYEAGIAMLAPQESVAARNQRGRDLADKNHSIMDNGAAENESVLGDLNDLCNEIHQWVDGEVSKWIERGRIVGTIGGDHSVAYGAINAHLRRYPNMALLQVDAHADLRLAYEGLTWSHASVMRNLIDNTELGLLVQVGLRDVSPGEVAFSRMQSPRIVSHFDADLAAAAMGGVLWAATVERIVSDLPDEVYISFDIDGLDASLCPNTGTPVPGGLSFHQACALFAGITSSGRRVVGFDLTEVAPGPGAHEKSWDAVVGAHIIYRLCGHALLGHDK
ncbi:MAG: hypothetical protein A2341_01210 [Deltaproteobacteria bacterium RIFOXYB12_FULL_58_9]|nr:MAG: hypothetical protein A2341_01210 [Deltaproteobacteria bacterium RIFOXYB12_FULL_58_9]